MFDKLVFIDPEEVSEASYVPSYEARLFEDLSPFEMMGCTSPKTEHAYHCSKVTCPSCGATIGYVIDPEYDFMMYDRVSDTIRGYPLEMFFTDLPYRKEEDFVWSKGTLLVSSEDQDRYFSQVNPADGLNTYFPKFFIKEKASKLCGVLVLSHLI